MITLIKKRERIKKEGTYHYNENIIGVKGLFSELL